MAQDDGTKQFVDFDKLTPIQQDTANHILQTLKEFRDKGIDLDSFNSRIEEEFKLKDEKLVNPENSLLPESLKPPEKVETIARTNVNDIESMGTTGETFVVNNNNYNTSNSSVNNQTDVHSGKLDTGIDPYFEKNATNVA